METIDITKIPDDKTLHEIHDEIASRVFDLIQDICKERNICPVCSSVLICHALGQVIAGSILAEDASEAKEIVEVIAKGIGRSVRVRSPEHRVH